MHLQARRHGGGGGSTPPFSFLLVSSVVSHVHYDNLWGRFFEVGKTNILETPPPPPPPGSATFSGLGSRSDAFCPPLSKCPWCYPPCAWQYDVFPAEQCVRSYLSAGHTTIYMMEGLTLISPGGGAAPAPLDIFRDKSAARVGLAARFHEFFPYRFAHILRPNL